MKIKFFTYGCVVYIECNLAPKYGAFLHFGVCNRTVEKAFSFKRTDKHITIDVGPLLHAFVYRRINR